MSLAGAAASTMMADAGSLVVRKLNKAFNGVPVLKELSLAIREGEVHGLCGTNGSGKSTFIRILAGYHRADSGTICVAGHEYRFPSATPVDPERSCIAFVHQNLGLLTELSICENFYIDEISRATSTAPISWAEKHRTVRALMEEYGIMLRSTTIVQSIPLVDRARLAILRSYHALRKRTEGGQTGLLVLDEPTVFLPAEDRAKLSDLIKDITRRGSSVLLVSHDLSDVRAVADRVTVLRDGHAVATVDTADTDDDAIVTLLLGRPLHRRSGNDSPSPAGLGHNRGATSGPTAPRLVAITGLAGGHVRSASFELAAGEIVGLSGLPGSGFEDIPYLLYGAITAGAGQMEIGTATVPIRALPPRVARQLGVALVPADRPGQGGLSELSSAENLVMPVLRHTRSKFRLLSSARIRDRFSAIAELYDIRPRQPNTMFGLFSGGNQQKIVLAKWLQTHPRLLLLHEPTQGVDVAAKFDIIGAIRQAADRGSCVVWASTDQEELANVTNRVLVFREGRIQAEVRQPFSGHTLLDACYGSTPATA